MITVLIKWQKDLLPCTARDPLLCAKLHCQGMSTLSLDFDNHEQGYKVWLAKIKELKRNLITYQTKKKSTMWWFMLYLKRTIMMRVSIVMPLVRWYPGASNVRAKVKHGKPKASDWCQVPSREKDCSDLFHPNPHSSPTTAVWSKVVVS